MAEQSKEGIKLPYVPSTNNIKRTLDKAIEASTPDRFTQDFLDTKLGIKGGAGKPVIPFLKRTGFLKSDGSPSELYNQFRTESGRGAAAAKALKHGYSTLYEMNEYTHELDDKRLKDLVVQATGAASGSSTVKAICGSFKILKSYANFEVEEEDGGADQDKEDEVEKSPSVNTSKKDATNIRSSFNLGYTINLNLPATADIAVYNAIFKSLKEHLLDE